MQRSTFFIIQLIFFSVFTFKAQELNPVPQKVFADKAQAHQSKKTIILYFYTDWCSVCRIQKNVLKQSPELVEKLKEKAEFITMNAEAHKEAVTVMGKTYEYIPNGSSGLHELAYEFSAEQQVYPLWVFIDPSTGKWSRYEGLLKTEDLEYILKANP
ncbi:Thioredoxin-related protein [Cruoricaptor ignavus]|uniref:Thioredoxin-related protein n=1 Tax=Cruoricaptor ignavus TaxID=1118202 RepID=A0A1M6HS30_9FLAO|nr:thioredoxin family protein [Cruoricaptor ignavus]SHJ24934.1 Thioredoxin-related protein [Cruoricaptor ignavus]